MRKKYKSTDPRYDVIIDRGIVVKQDYPEKTKEEWESVNGEIPYSIINQDSFDDSNIPNGEISLIDEIK